MAADAPAEELVHPGCPLGVLNGQADDVAVPELRAVTGRFVLVRKVRQGTPSTVVSSTSGAPKGAQPAARPAGAAGGRGDPGGSGAG